MGKQLNEYAQNDTSAISVLYIDLVFYLQDLKLDQGMSGFVCLMDRM